MYNIDSIKSFGALILITLFIIIKDKEKRKSSLELIKDPMFSINMIVVVLFVLYMLNSDDNSKEGLRRKEATKQAVLGLLIALMAHLGMKVAPFWLIWVASYYLNA